MRDNLTLDGVIVALCLDYERRKSAIEEKSFRRRTLMEYDYINKRIYEAAAEVVGEADAELYIAEIGEKIGYAKSGAPLISEVSYKRKKSEVKRNIALKLHLTD
ncbi:MAG: hypothetical protein IIX96_01495 [Clostridia bacterium]|nr:hypothetical protein [Clostridia bacterium]